MMRVLLIFIATIFLSTSLFSKDIVIRKTCTPFKMLSIKDSSSKPIAKKDAKYKKLQVSGTHVYYNGESYTFDEEHETFVGNKSKNVITISKDDRGVFVVELTQKNLDWLVAYRCK